MDRNKVLFIDVVVTILVIFIICLIYSQHKKTKTLSKAYDKIFGIVVILYIPIFVACNAVIQYDVDGHGYFLNDDIWKNGTYLSENNCEYNIKDNRVVNKYNENDTHLLINTYLSQDGYLIFDENHLYYKSFYDGVYVNNDNQRVYQLDMCYWDIFGNMRLPESKGFYYENSYIKPMIIDSDHNSPLINNISSILEFLIIGPCLVIGVKYLYLTIKKYVIKRDTIVDYKKGVCNLCIHTLIFFQIYFQSFFAESFFHSFIIIIASSVISILVISLVQGIMYCYNEKEENKTIGYILKSCDRKELIHLYLQYYIMLFVYYLLWIVYDVVVCIGKI